MCLGTLWPRPVLATGPSMWTRSTKVLGATAYETLWFVFFKCVGSLGTLFKEIQPHLDLPFVLLLRVRVISLRGRGDPVFLKV